MTDEAFEQWKASVMGPAGRIVYTGEHTRAVAFPLGGIGTGHVCLCGDGSLRQWQIFNQTSHDHYVPHSFFAIRVAGQGRGRPPVAKLLISDQLYDSEIENVPTVSDHLVPEELRRLLAELPGVQGTEFVGEYPIAELRYLDDELPVQVSLQAFCPMVPLNEKDSGLPGIVFQFTLRNTTDGPVEVSLLGSLQNAVGASPHADIKGVQCRDYGGNFNTVAELRDLTAIQMGNAWLKDDEAQRGSMCLAVVGEGATARAQWDDLSDLWQEFSETGRLSRRVEAMPSSPGRTWNGALAVPVRLEPKEERTVTFLMTWHFPNHYVNWGQGGFGITDTKTKLWLGNMYGNWFGGALEVAEYLRDHSERLSAETRLYRNTVYDSTLPYWLIDAFTSQTSTIRTPTVLWNEDGNLHGFEGCGGASTNTHCCGTGCCPLNCTHVWNYEMALARLYPGLQRTMRLTDLMVQMNERGGIAYRTTLPLWLPRWWHYDPEHPINCADGHWGTILKTCREFRQSGDVEFLRTVWPKVKLAMEFGIGRWDAERDGILEGPQWNTYDLDFGGKNTFCTGLYLTALKGAAYLARHMGEEDLAAEWEALATRGGENVDAQLFNGEFYIQLVDEKQFPKLQYGPGCLSDQVWGQWWAEQLDLGYTLDAENVRSALRAIYKHNFRRDFAGFTQWPRTYVAEDEMGLLICTWPNGGRQEHPMLYCDEVWTHYHVPAHMLWEGMTEEAYQIVKANRDRFDGRRRSPWNDVECGDHYARPMSSWSLLEAASGFRYSAPEQSLAFAPRVDRKRFRSFFITANGWGSFGQKIAKGAQTNTLSVAYGQVEVRTLKLALGAPRLRVQRAKVTLAGREVKAKLTVEEGVATLKFSRGITVSAGQALEVVLGEA